MQYPEDKSSKIAVIALIYTPFTFLKMLHSLGMIPTEAILKEKGKP